MNPALYLFTLNLTYYLINSNLSEAKIYLIRLLHSSLLLITFQFHGFKSSLLNDGS